ncbi:MAG: hypothetical protein IJ223_01735 [Clostridia bacterium]|nr:hypothetical protein [Clostridia bacterium]
MKINKCGNNKMGETKEKMKNGYYLYKKNIKHFLGIMILLAIIALWHSKSYAFTINDSNISINVDSTGICKIDEKLYVTAIDESSAYTWDYSQYPSIRITRGKIEKVYVDNLELSNYYEKWGYNTKNEYNPSIPNSYSAPGYVNPFSYNANNDIAYIDKINLFYPKKSRKISIFIILYKGNKNNFL